MHKILSNHFKIVEYNLAKKVLVRTKVAYVLLKFVKRKEERKEEKRNAT